MSVKIKWAPQHGTSQVYSSGIEMALCSANNEQIGPWVFCKDFFQDAIRGFVNDIQSSIWGYSYNPKSQPPIDLERVRVLMTNDQDKDFLKKMPNVVDFLNQIEKKMGLRKTEAFEASDPPDKYAKSGVVLFIGSGKWLQSSASLSMYTLLMRNSLNHKVGSSYEKTLKAVVDGSLAPGQRNDNTYLKYGMPGIELIIDKGIVEVFGKNLKDNYKSSVPTGTIHHNGGIVSFGCGKTAGTWPHWKQPKNPSVNPPSICFG